MTTRKRYAFWIDERQHAALEAIRARDGILPSEQIRRGIDLWLKAKQAAVPRTRPKSAGNRTRPHKA